MQAAFGAYAAQERSAGLGGIEVKDRQAAPAHDMPGVLVRQGAAGWETVGQGRRGKALTARSSGRSRGGSRPRKKRSTATATGRSTLDTAAARCRVLKALVRVALGHIAPGRLAPLSNPVSGRTSVRGPGRPPGGRFPGARSEGKARTSPLNTPFGVIRGRSGQVRAGGTIRCLAKSYRE